MGTPALVDGPEEDPPALAAFVALQPVMDIQDRTVFGYEALPRGPMSSDSTEFVRAALSAVQHTSPGLLFVPLAGSLLEDETFEPLGSAEAIGAASPEIVWLISEATFLESPELVRRRVEQLHGWGFLVAIGDVAPGVLSRAPVGQLMPSFLILDPTFAEHVSTGGMLERAELAGLLAYYARLNAHVIARGIVDDAIADRMIGLGVRFGIGPHLGSPPFSTRAPQSQGTRSFLLPGSASRAYAYSPRTGRVLDAPALFAELPSGGDVPVDAQASHARLARQPARCRPSTTRPRSSRSLRSTCHSPFPPTVSRFFEADWDRYRLRARVLAGDDLQGLNDLDISMDRGITGWAFLRGLPYNCSDTRDHTEAVSIPGQDESTSEESLLVVPLIAGDHRLGAIDVWRNGLGKFTDEDLERCALFGYITAAAWRNAQLYAEVELRAMTDTLTGLLNHRWWDELAPREAARASRAGTQIGILLIDLDHFKRVNDRCGHVTGDAVLHNVGRALQTTLRKGDAAIRYGGEEFLLLLNDSDEAGARRSPKPYGTS